MLKIIPTLVLLSVSLQAFFYLPLFFYWQIPLSLIAIAISHLWLAVLPVASKFKLKKLCYLLLVFSISVFYLQTFSLLPKKQNLKEPIVLSEQPGPNNIRIDDLKFSHGENLSFVGTAIESFNQRYGKVAVVRFITKDAKSFTLAVVKTENLFGRDAWFYNRILLRRISSNLRQRKEPLLVLVYSPLNPAGSQIFSQFAFQARIKRIYSTSFLRGFWGFGSSPILLARDLNVFQTDQGELALQLE